MNTEFKTKLVQIIAAHPVELKLSGNELAMARHVISINEPKPCELTFPGKKYSLSFALDYLTNNFQDAVRRFFPDEYKSI